MGRSHNGIQGVSSADICRCEVIKNASDAVIRIGLPTSVFTNMGAQGIFRSLILVRLQTKAFKEFFDIGPHQPAGDGMFD
jgi:hypothetical protein